MTSEIDRSAGGGGGGSGGGGGGPSAIVLGEPEELWAR